MYHILIYI